MPTITLSNPPLTTGQFYQVRYRLLPSGTWVLLPLQTNAPFTINGLADGTYELEVSIVYGSPIVICDPVYLTFIVGTGSEDCECLTDVTAAITVDRFGERVLTINSTIPSTEPPCGWVIKIVELGTNATITSSYTSLPSSFDIMLPQSDAPCYHVYIYKDCCGDGKMYLCWDDELCEPEEPCIAATLNSVDLQLINGSVYLRVDITQAIPPSSSILVTYSQVNNLFGGLPDSGTFNYTGLSNLFYIKLNPNFFGVNGLVSYAGTITDGCGGLLYFDESIIL